MNEEMKFPEIFEEFAKEYGFKDDKEVYTNGSDLIPIFRVKQWLEHDNLKTGHWIKYSIPRCGEQHYKCTSCGYYINFGQWGELYTKEFKYCPNCGVKMVEPQETRIKDE